MSLRPAVSGKRSHELNHRIKAFLLSGSRPQGLITSDFQDRGKLPGISSDYIVIEIPCIDPKRLLLIHGTPSIRSPECIDIQQAFVDYRKSICHRSAILFLDLYSKLLLRQDHILCLDERMQYRLRIYNLCSLNAVEPDRLIIKSLAMRLKHCRMYIEVWSHLLCHL